ncbi:MAG: hypothetical protein CL886_05370 [Dehalococcoidia bacterium]|nr:hypothetical protein [Dehalococcoidia bacterium]
MPLFNLILLHHGESADPELLKWIKDLLDHFFGSGPWAVVILLGSAICLMPLIVILVYIIQNRR